jgi:hypothetical protein
VHPRIIPDEVFGRHRSKSQRAKAAGSSIATTKKAALRPVNKVLEGLTISKSVISLSP